LGVKDVKNALSGVKQMPGAVFSTTNIMKNQLTDMRRQNELLEKLVKTLEERLRKN